MEEGRKICSLPDPILVDIISRLDLTEEAVRTSILSKRWRYLWRSVSNLIFVNSFDGPVVDFFSFVSQTVTQCDTHLNLNKFLLETWFVNMFESQINEYIHYAVTRNVQDLYLSLLYYQESFAFEFADSFFTVSCFTKLKMSRVILNPKVTISWKCLTSLCISHVNLNDDLVQSILIGCPVLEFLELKKCYGYKRLDVTSKSVKTLVLNGYGYYENDVYAMHGDIIQINAPYIVSLLVRKRFILLNAILLNVSSLVEAKLDYKKHGWYDITKKEAEQDMLKGFLQSLSHVKDLTIGSLTFKVFYRLKAEGFIFPSNLKVVDSDSMKLSDWYDTDTDDPYDSEESWSDDGSEGDEVN